MVSILAIMEQNLATTRNNEGISWRNGRQHNRTWIIVSECSSIPGRTQRADIGSAAGVATWGRVRKKSLLLSMDSDKRETQELQTNKGACKAPQISPLWRPQAAAEASR